MTDRRRDPMRVWRRFAVAAPTALAAASLVFVGVAAGNGSPTVTESDDTGDLPGVAQVLPTAVGSVSGSVDRAGDVDLYRFCVSDQGFVVSTVNEDTRITDTELFVFHADGTALRYNDDWAGTWRSTVTVAPGEAAPGQYLVAVGSRYNRALNAEGKSLFQPSIQKQVDPDHGVGDLVLDRWAYSSHATGAYRIDFTGTTDCGTAEPGDTTGPVRVGLDVKPGSDHNPINSRSGGRTPLALLGSVDLDIRTVDAATLRAGPGGAELAGTTTVVDVNDDGVADLVGHVHTRQLGLTPGDDELCVEADAADGPVRGCDTVRVR